MSVGHSLFGPQQAQPAKWKNNVRAAGATANEDFHESMPKKI